MPEEIAAESLTNNITDTISDVVSKNENTPIFDEQDSASAELNRLFGRQKPIHHVLGGGKSADVLLWRNKKVSAGSLGAATVVWVLCEWLNYHLLTLLCFLVVIGLAVQFLGKNASGMLSSDPPRLALPEEVFVNIGKMIGSEVNRGLSYLQDVACEGNLKQFLVVVASLWVASIIGSWCNLFTVLYIGYVAAHTLPIFYERYEDQVDGFVNNVVQQLLGHYKKFDDGVLSKIPAAKFMVNKSE